MWVTVHVTAVLTHHLGGTETLFTTDSLVCSNNQLNKKITFRWLTVSPKPQRLKSALCAFQWRLKNSTKMPQGFVDRAQKPGALIWFWPGQPGVNSSHACENHIYLSGAKYNFFPLSDTEITTPEILCPRYNGIPSERSQSKLRA